MTDTPKSVTGVKKENNEKRKNKVVSAAPHSQNSATDFFFSTGITDFANYSLRNTPYVILCADQFKMSGSIEVQTWGSFCSPGSHTHQLQRCKDDSPFVAVLRLHPKKKILI